MSPKTRILNLDRQIYNLENLKYMIFQHLLYEGCRDLAVSHMGRGAAPYRDTQKHEAQTFWQFEASQRNDTLCNDHCNEAENTLPTMPMATLLLLRMATEATATDTITITKTSGGLAKHNFGFAA